MVKQELDLVHDETKVYKMVGPVLLKQDLEEAKTNVNKRIEFIKHELYTLSRRLPSLAMLTIIILADIKLPKRSKTKKMKRSKLERR